ncbi:serine/threonine protein kinase [Ktedonosporobacter rubrisoli]|nr:protein kinase [Ktedonosporobacter rubrisoli]
MPLENIQLGHYRLSRQIGKGGMGEVYLAEDTLLPRQVAIKVIRIESTRNLQEAARLFQREMIAISKLDHLYILPLFDYGEETLNQQTLSYMVMPYRPEGSLEDWLQEHNSAPIPVITHFMLQAANALQHAHDHQLIHQDVKPSNFLLRQSTEHLEYPDILLADFGIAKLEATGSLYSLVLRGTPAYMAPEQWQKQSEPASDQYALAVMAYQLLTDQLPYTGSLEQVMHQHFTAQPQPPSELNPQVSAALDSVVLRALAKKPQERFPSILQFAQAFQQAAQTAGDLYASLSISQEEALQGTSRKVNLPGRRKISIMIPPYATDGQEIRIPDQGEPHYEGGPRGALILTLMVANTSASSMPQSEVQASGQPAISQGQLSGAEYSQASEQAASSKDRQPGAEYSTVLAQSQIPDYLPVHVPGTDLSPAHTRSAAIRPLQAQFISASAPALFKERVARAPKWKLAVLIGLALVIILAGAMTVNSLWATTNPSTNHTTTPTAAHTTATTAISTSANNSAYPAYLPGKGKFVYADPLTAKHSSHWSNFETCTFEQDGYHISVTQQNYNTFCTAADSFSNLAFEVQMRILKGDCGGAVIRSDGMYTFYAFQICTNGNYELDLVASANPNAPTNTLKTGYAAPLHTGLNQSNTLAIAANGDNISIFVNGHQLDHITDKTLKSGQIGLIVGEDSKATEAVFQNARVWTY